MTPAQFRKAGESLARNDPETYGRGWQSALARVIKVNTRTVRAWLSGQNQMPAPVWELIKRLVEESRKQKPRR